MYTDLEKQQIANKIKPITLEEAIQDFIKLKNIGVNAASMSSRSRIGNDAVDYFTFVERLNTKGKYNASFYDFLQNLDEFKKKKFIQNMLTYYATVKNKNNTKNEYVVYKEVYNICISAINIFRPLVSMEIYARFKPYAVLDFTCGWGGRLIGACALNIPHYIGIDMNINLENSYKKMCAFLKENELTNTQIDLHFLNALDFDYTKIEYDMVLTSPPYYFLEKYSCNTVYDSKTEMKDHFYKPIFKKTYDGLKKGGTYCLNVNNDIYTNICLELFGKATYEIPLKKSKRQNDYSESIYIWIKQ